jgi:hypothetical protein
MARHGSACPAAGTMLSEAVAKHRDALGMRRDADREAIASGCQTSETLHRPTSIADHMEILLQVSQKNTPTSIRWYELAFVVVSGIGVSGLALYPLVAVLTAH